jgi:tight adherence protein B
MIIGILITLSVTLIAFIALSTIEEKLAAKRRLSLVFGERIAPQTGVAFNKDKIVAKQNAEKHGKTSNRTTLAMLIMKAGLDFNLNQVRLMALAFALVSGILVFLFTSQMALSGLATIFGFVVVPRLVLGVLIRRREAAITESLPDALDIISRGLRSGMTLANCFKQVAESMPDPLRSEFANVIDLQKIGIPTAEAIKRMPERIDLLDIRFFSIVIEIQQKTGGNLSEILENLSNVVRARKEMKAKIRALTAEAKASSIIIGIIPLCFAALSWYTDPATFSKFWTETIGQMMIGLAGLLYVVGIAIFAKIGSPKI